MTYVDCPKISLSILRDYLTDRAVTLEYAGISVTKFLTCGCPQGGVLSPFIWNLYIDGLLRLLEQLGIDVQGWADDIVVSFHIDCLDDFNAQISKAVQVLEKI